jgi:transcription-repair coupling factor (superfamily II helicase)
LQIKFHPGSKIEPVKLMALVSSREGAQFTPAGVLKLPLPVSDKPAEVLDFVEQSLKVLSA